MFEVSSTARRTSTSVDPPQGRVGGRISKFVLHGCPVLAFAVTAFVAPMTGGAEEPERDPGPQIVRELYIPQDDLNVLLKGAGRRIFLTREEYDGLLATVRQQRSAAAPVPLTLVHADYQAEIDFGRARIQGRLVLDCAEDGLHRMQLPLDHVAIRSATLDDDPAPIAHGPGEFYDLFVEGRGRHELELELMARVTIAAARQTVKYRLPYAAGGRLRLSVPGNIEIKSGAEVLSREYLEQPAVTHFELLPKRDSTHLVMSLNNQLSQERQLILARNVVVEEFTETYERLHVTASMKVLHGTASRFRFAIPVGWEITDVVTPLLSRWQVASSGDAAAEGDRQILEVELRDEIRDDVVMNIAAHRTTPPLAGWTMPAFEPLDVASSVTVVGLLVEQGLELQSLTSEGLIPVDVATLTATLPASVLEAESGAPAIRPTAAYYAPGGDFRLAADFAKPAGRVQVVSNLLLVVEPSGLEAVGGFALLPMGEDIFGCNFSVPAGWHIKQVTYGDGSPLEFERYDENENGDDDNSGNDARGRIHVRLPQRVPAGQLCSIHFVATHVPENWSEEWSSRDLQLPEFQVAKATSDRGAVAVQASEDLKLLIVSTEGLVPLDENNKPEYQLDKVPTDLAFRYDARPFAADLTVRRIEARLTAETYSFFKIKPGRLKCHYELVYDVGRAATRVVEFALPSTTPAELTIRGLGVVGIKETESIVRENERLWRVWLTEAQRGPVRLAVDFELTSDTSPSVRGEAGETEPVGRITLPVVSAAAVEYQSGAVAVEGDAELEIELRSEARRLDVGELVDAAYQPGKRLLGVYGFLGSAPRIMAEIRRPVPYALPSAIVQRAELVASLSASGVCQSAARYLLRTKAPFIEVELPADSTLWSAVLDREPVKPQRDGQRLLIGFPSGSSAALRDLQLTYETARPRLHWWSEWQSAAPALYLRSSSHAPRVELPTADLVWHVALPPGFHITDNRGSVYPDLTDSATLRVFAERRRWRGPWAQLASVGETAPPASVEATADSADGAVAEGAFMAERSEAARESGGIAEVGREGAFFEQMDANEEDRIQTLAESRDRRRDVVRGEAAAPQQGGEFGAGRPPAAEPPPMEEEEQTVEKKASALKGAAWALAGLRSLKIDLTASSPQAAFLSLGAEPRLQLTLVDSRRLEFLGWALTLLVLAAGIGLLRSRFSTQFKFVAVVLVLSQLLPLLTGWEREFGPMLDFTCYATLWLIPFFLAIHLLRWLGNAAGAAIVIALAVATGCPTTQAQEEAAQFRPLTVKLVPPDEPVVIPADVLVVPYDPLTPAGVTEADQVIVPYDHYTQLIEQIDAQQTEPPPEVDWSWAGAEWATTLQDGDFLGLEGKLQIDVFVDGPVTVPVALSGGVVAHATTDGQPARIRFLDLPPDPPANETEPNQQPRQAASRAEPGRVMVLDLDGPGRREVRISLRYSLTRRGGWRVVEGALPFVPAAAISLTVPRKETELRLSGVVEQPLITSAKDDWRIETTLSHRGDFQFQWRPAVAASSIDSSLTVASEAVFDIQEDGLRLVWHMALSFPRSERDAFTLTLPEQYVVQQVDADNLQQWQRDGDRLVLTLLQSVRDAQRVTLYLARRGNVGQGELSTFELPAVQVTDAALHEGRLAIRRSPLLGIQTGDSEGLTRTDVASVEFVRSVTNESPLGIRPFQAYQFYRTPYHLDISASPVPARVAVEFQTLLRASELERTLEARALFQVDGRPVYQLHFDLPADLMLKEVVAPGSPQWSVVDVPPPADEPVSRRRLSIFLATGQRDKFAVVLRGVWGRRGPAESVNLPAIVSRQADKQQTTIVVQTDPSFDVRAGQLEGCQTELLQRTYGWLADQQRQLSRLAVHAPAEIFSGAVQLVKKRPRIRCQTVSNLRVTTRAFEETILLDFDISGSGVRDIAFLLPEDLRAAQINAPLLRQQTIEDAEAGQVRVRLQLQDEVTGQFRVLIQHDRLITDDRRAVPLPTIETGTTLYRFVAIESAGRDEIVIAEQTELEPLTRQQQQWRDLAELLGTGVTQAYLVAAGATDPRLVIQLQDRQAVETVGARVLFARTKLVVDAHGTYRGEQLYQVDNRTEQFLEVSLPANTRAWTVRVANEPVKPTEGSSSLRIPLVKTSAGDQDYPVVIKYGGVLEGFRTLQTVDFPLMETTNVMVEESQVRLFLPKSQRWFNFGGTMRLAGQEQDLLAGYLKYKNLQILNYSSSLASGNPFTRARSANNLRELIDEVESFQQLSQDRRFMNAELQAQIESNRQVIGRAKRELADQQQQRQTDQRVDNRFRLGNLFGAQEADVSRNAVNEQANNFATAQPRASELSRGDREVEGQNLRRGWIHSNIKPLELPGQNLPTDSSKPGSGRIVSKSQPMTGNLRGKFVPQLQGYESTRDAKKNDADLDQLFDRGRDRRSGQDESGRVQRFEQRLTTSDAPTVAAEQAAAGPGSSPPRGLASLQVELTTRGDEYLFLTPRGDMQISARFVRHESLGRLVQLAVILVVLLIVVAAYRVAARQRTKET